MGLEDVLLGLFLPKCHCDPLTPGICSGSSSRVVEQQSEVMSNDVIKKIRIIHAVKQLGVTTTPEAADQLAYVMEVCSPPTS